MPVIVDEIVISVEVGTQDEGSPAPAAGGTAEAHHALISECVERVLDVLSQKDER